MYGNLEDAQLDGAVEALLFVSDEPVNVLTLAEMLEADPASVEEALTRIAARKEAERAGVLLQEVAGGWRLYTNPAYHELLEKYVLSWDTRRLSQAALETLAIIAYGQPITRLGIASIRGVNSDSSVNSLIDKGLVRESGQADAPGYPMTYSTTRTFLEKFGLRDCGDLPDLEDFAPDDETATLLRQGLSAHAHFGLREDDDAPNPADTLADAMRDALADAIAQSVGVVEKIDFEQLEFEE
ncbi:MAG: SMC-Scp complex subunit ScpB [Coriobacteriaceae bacterium]|nr:SMC-Scp complex subunit ScpB [Coriobacteriaceae bacterium]